MVKQAITNGQTSPPGYGSGERARPLAPPHSAEPRSLSLFDHYLWSNEPAGPRQSGEPRAPSREELQ